jgi:hypothetical protein
MIYGITPYKISLVIVILLFCFIFYKNFTSTKVTYPKLSVANVSWIPEVQITTVLVLLMVGN